MDDPNLRAFPGTDRLGRALTDAEKKDLAALLRAHDFVGASLVALAFAFKLTRSQPAAQDLRGRANLRLVRHGWDPRVVTLVKCLCRYTWSEWTHQLEDTVAARNAEEVFLREREVLEGKHERTHEDRAVEVQESFDRKTRARTHIDSLRFAFEQSNDQVNLDWLKYAEQEITSVAEMVKLSGHTPQEFYDAADRRKRLVKKILAAWRGTPEKP